MDIKYIFIAYIIAVLLKKLAWNKTITMTMFCTQIYV